MVLDNTPANLVNWFSVGEYIYLSFFSNQLVVAIQELEYIKQGLILVIMIFLMWNVSYTLIKAGLMWYFSRYNAISDVTENENDKKKIHAFGNKGLQLFSVSIMNAISQLLLYMILTITIIILADYFNMSQYGFLDNFLSTVVILPTMYASVELLRQMTIEQ